MKILIFSDTHLTDKYNARLFNFLTQIINDSDQVIINGDFWDGMSVSFEDFINSQWKELFPLLKSKKTIYIYGNHDRKSYADTRVNLFSAKQETSYLLPTTNYLLNIQHGHEIIPLGDFEVADPLVYRRSNNLYTFVESIAGFFAHELFTLFYRVVFSGKMKRYVQTQLKKNEILVVGHIHAPEFNLKKRYINTFIRHSVAYYLTIDDGTIEFHKKRY